MGAGSLIKIIREEGYIVEIVERRPYVYRWDRHDHKLMTKQQATEDTDYQLQPTGGETYIRVLCPDGSWGDGRAVCSFKDKFTAMVGVDLAFQRALRDWNQRTAQRVARRATIASANH